MATTEAAALSLRRCALALLVFLAAVLPFQWLCMEPYARVVLTAGDFVSRLVVPAREIVRSADGRRFEFDRLEALREFFDDPLQRPRSYGILVLWCWIAVAPLRSLRERLRIAAGATVFTTGVYALALTCSAVAWYRRSVAAQLDAGVPLSSGWIGTLDALGTVLTMAALFVLPLILGLAVYPGLRLGPRNGAIGERVP